MSGVKRTVRMVGIELALPVAALAGWWATSLRSTSVYFPPLADIASQFRTDFIVGNSVEADLLPSLRNWAIGMGIAIIFGLSVGVALGLSRVAHAIFRPLIDGLRSTPTVVLLPVALALFSIGPAMNIAIIAFAATWPILLNAIAGVQAIHPAVHDMRHIYNIHGIRVIRQIILPAASPQAILGVRQGISLGLMLLVLSELEGSTSGIGYYTLQAQHNFLIPSMWAGMFVLALLGYIINLAFRGVERVLLGWHYQLDARAAAA